MTLKPIAQQVQAIGIMAEQARAERSRATPAATNNDRTSTAPASSERPAGQAIQSTITEQQGKEQIMGSIIRCDFIKAQARKDYEERIHASAADRQRRVESAARLAAVPPRYLGKDFYAFVASIPEQEQVRDRCFSYARSFDNVMAVGANLVMIGPPGTGKTHLSCAIIQNILGRGFTGLFVTQSDLLKRIRASYDREAAQREEEVIESFRRPDLLVIDEIGVGIGNPANRTHQLHDIINDRYNHRRPTVVLSNLTEEQLRRYLGARLWDRLIDFSSGSNLIRMDWPSWRQTGATRATA